MTDTLKIKDRASIPNKAGFTFHAHLLSGEVRLAVVERDETGCHRIKDLPVAQVRGWTCVPTEKEKRA